MYFDLPKNYVQMCIDFDHEDYMRKYYPEIKLLSTMPLAGSNLREAREIGDYSGSLDGFPKKIQDRTYDVVFTGNYTKPETFETYITGKGAEYETFYRGMLKEFLEHPERNLNVVFEKHIRENIGELEPQEVAQAFHYLMFLDMYIRFYYRGEVIRYLTEAGLKVHIVGAGWEALDTKRPDLLVCHGK